MRMFRVLLALLPAISMTIAGRPKLIKKSLFPVKDLTRIVLSRYGRLGQGLPVQDASEALKVDFDISLQQILNVDIKEETFTTVLWYNYQWKDAGLTWNSSDYNNIKSIRVEPSDIYIPDIIPYHVVPGRYDVMRTPVVIYSDGTCSWVPPVTLTTSCSMPDGRYTDDITCNIKFGSWTFDGNHLNVTSLSDGVDLSTYQINRDWELLEAPLMRTVKYFDCCPDPYIDLTAKFHLVKN